ncbi:hypothetical protein ACF3MZ_14295 [Paenibacillaceae bacterium WGS1546]|uniref:hypothetical protein n=1 Tax=Cohnella sp. WGS1546 TaxID=3366810 RepID=UPI00372D0166
MNKESMEFAVQQMSALGMSYEVIDRFKSGVVCTTLMGQPETSVVPVTNKEELKVIAEMKTRGFIVYPVLPSALVVDHSVLMYSVAYLVVLANVWNGIELPGALIDKEEERNKALQEYMQNEVSAAQRGFALAYVVNEAWGVSEFGDVVVRPSARGGLTRIG